MSSAGDPRPRDFRREYPPDEVTIVSWPACVAIVILLVALFFVLPHF